jgi:hypothetical protein
MIRCGDLRKWLETPDDAPVRVYFEDRELEIRECRPIGERVYLIEVEEVQEEP